MAKRKKTDVVKLQLRIREGLRRKLEAAANAEERSLNSEIAYRLEKSFDQDKNSHLLEALLAPGAGLELIRDLGTILRGAGRDWYNPPKSHAVAEAIRKVIAVISGELPPTEASFPNRYERGSADQLAWLAATPTTGILALNFQVGEEPPTAELIRETDKGPSHAQVRGQYNERSRSRTR